jgi:hypothetical protein
VNLNGKAIGDMVRVPSTDREALDPAQELVEEPTFGAMCAECQKGSLDDKGTSINNSEYEDQRRIKTLEEPLEAKNADIIVIGTIRRLP